MRVSVERHEVRIKGGGRRGGREAMEVPEMVLVVVSVPIRVERMFIPGDTEARNMRKLAL